ncbi:MAG: AN1-type zinc finger domain-containing protein [Candidatus Bathyarchaeia archaeon]
MKCQQCDAETYMPFKCPYCSQYFCVEHRLPENHDCPEYWRARAPREQPAIELKKPSEPFYRHSVTMRPTKHGGIISFSITELKHLLVGVLLTLAIGFSIPLYWDPGLYQNLLMLSVMSIIFAVSFIVHELAHKLTAQHHGMWAEFRITMFGALITLMSIISPFKIIAPGAVMVWGLSDRETIGKTSIAGPLTNISLAVFFLALIRMLPLSPIAHAFYFGLLINSVIALFNLIPFGVLDGYKVFNWNKLIWAAAFFGSLALTVYSYVI